MAEIGNVTGLFIRPDVSLADVEHLSKPMVQGALPPALAPLSTPEQHQIIGGSVGSSEVLRLEPPKDLTSTQVQMRNLRSVLERLKVPAQGHRFASMEAMMQPILRQHMVFMQQITSELSHGRT